MKCKQRRLSDSIYKQKYDRPTSSIAAVVDVKLKFTQHSCSSKKNLKIIKTKKKNFPYRELNPGLLGESQLSQPLDHMGLGIKCNKNVKNLIFVISYLVISYRLRLQNRFFRKAFRPYVERAVWQMPIVRVDLYVTKTEMLTAASTIRIHAVRDIVYRQNVRILEIFWPVPLIKARQTLTSKPKRLLNVILVM